MAAGESKRLGFPKQLIKRDKTTLLNYTIGEALKSKATDVYVVLGSSQPDVQSSITYQVPTFFSVNWKDGMGTSISSSLSQITIDDYDGIILSVCDQFYISSKIFNNLIQTFNGGDSSIVVSKYKSAHGPPSLFGKKHYQSLLKLRGDHGAKDIVKNNLLEVSFIPFHDGYIDIDTEEDLKKLP